MTEQEQTEFLRGIGWRPPPVKVHTEVHTKDFINFSIVLLNGKPLPGTVPLDSIIAREFKAKWALWDAGFCGEQSAERGPVMLKVFELIEDAYQDGLKKVNEPHTIWWHLKTWWRNRP